MNTSASSYIDSPAAPVQKAVISYEGAVTTAGAATGTTLTCLGLATEPSYQGAAIKLLDGAAAGQVRPIAGHVAGTGLLTFAPFTDNAGAAVTIALGTQFQIISIGGGGSPAPVVSPSIGLWMFGVCDPGMAASPTAIVCGNLAGFPDDIFNDQFYMEVLYNADNPGGAPEGEIRLITDYVGATGAFVTNAFSADVEADDFVAIIHHSLVGANLNLLSTLTRWSFDLMNSMLTLMETGGTLTATGGEDDVYIVNTPAGVFSPNTVKVDLTNMAGGDTVVLRLYYRYLNGGNMILEDTMTFNGAQDEPSIPIQLDPNRFGVQTTLEQQAGPMRDFDWYACYKA